MNLLDFIYSEKEGHLTEALVCRRDIVGIDRIFKYADLTDSKVILRDCRIQTADLDSLVAAKCFLNLQAYYGIYVVVDKESRLAFIECYYEDKVFAGVVDIAFLSSIDVSGNLSFKKSLEEFICKLLQ